MSGRRNSVSGYGSRPSLSSLAPSTTNIPAVTRPVARPLSRPVYGQAPAPTSVNNTQSLTPGYASYTSSSSRLSSSSSTMTSNNNVNAQRSTSGRPMSIPMTHSGSHMGLGGGTSRYAMRGVASRLPHSIMDRLMRAVFESCVAFDPLDWQTSVEGRRGQVNKGLMMIKVGRVCRSWRDSAERVFSGSICVWNSEQIYRCAHQLYNRDLYDKVKTVALTFTGNPMRPGETHALLSDFIKLVSKLNGLRNLTLDFTLIPLTNEATLSTSFQQVLLMKAPNLTTLTVIRPPRVDTFLALLAQPTFGGLINLELVLRPEQRLDSNSLVHFGRPTFSLTKFRLSASSEVWSRDGSAIQWLLQHSWRLLEEVGITSSGHHGVIQACGSVVSMLAQHTRCLTTLAIKDDWDVRNPEAKQMRIGQSGALPPLRSLTNISLLNVIDPLRTLRTLSTPQLFELSLGGFYLGDPVTVAHMIQNGVYRHLNRLRIRQPMSWTADEMRGLRDLCHDRYLTRQRGFDLLFVPLTSVRA